MADNRLDTKHEKEIFQIINFDDLGKCFIDYVLLNGKNAAESQGDRWAEFSKAILEGKFAKLDKLNDKESTASNEEIIKFITDFRVNPWAAVANKLTSLNFQSSKDQENTWLLFLKFFKNDFTKNAKSNNSRPVIDKQVIETLNYVDIQYFSTFMSSLLFFVDDLFPSINLSDEQAYDVFLGKFLERLSYFIPQFLNCPFEISKMNSAEKLQLLKSFKEQLLQLKNEEWQDQIRILTEIFNNPALTSPTIGKGTAMWNWNKFNEFIKTNIVIMKQDYKSGEL